MKRRPRVTLVHLDLGIGGAERLVVDAALSMKRAGYYVQIVTSHHDVSHCFEETKPSNILGDAIFVYGDWLPRHIFGKATALCGSIRLLLLTVIVCFQYNQPDIVFIDGISLPLPVFSCFEIPTLFYCHFPDKLLCVERNSIAKRFYRFLIDSLEEWSMGFASEIAVNSQFTANVFRDSFSSLNNRHLNVLYPTVDTAEQSTVISNKMKTTSLSSAKMGNTEVISYCDDFDFVFVSLNRYERKKKIELAIHAIESVYVTLLNKIFGKNSMSESLSPSCGSPGSMGRMPKILLVISGGYDALVDENVHYYNELVALGLRISRVHENPQFNPQIIFRRSISTVERMALVSRATALLYTPDKGTYIILLIFCLFKELNILVKIHLIIIVAV